MKRLLLLAILFPTFTYCQDSSIVYRDIVAIDSTTKSELYQKAKPWIVNSFRNSKEVIRLDTEDKIISKGNFRTFTTAHLMGVERKVDGVCNFTMLIAFKDGRYKAEIYDMSFICSNNNDGNFKNITSAEKCPEKWPFVGQGKMNQMWKELKAHIDTECKYTLLSLKESMRERAKVDDF